MVDIQKAQITAGGLVANAYAGYDSSATGDGLANTVTGAGVFSLDFDWAGAGAGAARNAIDDLCGGTTVQATTISTLAELALIDNNAINP